MARRAKFHLLVVCIMVVTSLMLVAVVLGEEDTPEPTEFSGNWCLDGTWNSEFCSPSDPAIRSYIWRAGWCHAAIEAGIFETAEECMPEGTVFPQEVEEEIPEEEVPPVV